MKTKNEIKTELANLVARKKELTRARLAIKRIPFSERPAEKHREMLSLGNEASIQKESIRICQLAYAFVRGRSYWSQERHTIHPAAIYVRSIARETGASEVEVEAWLKAPVSDEERAAFEAHTARAREQARQRRRREAAE